MKGFKLDERGDIVFEKGKIAFVEDINLTVQTIRTVMGTNKGEWFLNDNEGIDFDFILGKGITDDMRLSQCADACQQVDSNLYVYDFRSEVDKKTRQSTLFFKAKDGGTTLISLDKNYGQDISETNANASEKLAHANEMLASNRKATEKLERRLSGL